MGDNLRTLSPDCREEVEAEANFAAARLLFLRDRFTEQARSAHPSINLIRSLGDTFGNTLSATLYHFVETQVPPTISVAVAPHASARASAQVTRPSPS